MQWITYLKRSIWRRSSVVFGFLWEVSICSKCYLLWIKRSSLSDSWCIWSLRIKYLWPPLDIILPDHVFFVFIQIFLIRYDLLKDSWYELISNVRRLLRYSPLLWSIMHVHELCFFNEFVTTTGFEYRWCLRPLLLFIVLPQEVLTGVYILVTYCIWLKLFESIKATSTRVGINVLNFTTFISFNTYTYTVIGTADNYVFYHKL